MLKAIEFENYKAFKNGRLEIKPITVLLGANSVGKSSLIQIFLMLHETALTENYKSALKLHGGFFSLGEGVNLFRKKDLNNDLSFGLEFEDSELKKFVQQDALENFVDELGYHCYFLLEQLVQNDNDKKFIAKHFRIKENNKFNRVVKYSTIKYFSSFMEFNKYDLVEIINQTSDLANARLKIDKKFAPSPVFITKNSQKYLNLILNQKEDLLATYEFLKNLSKLSDDESFKINYTLKYSDGILKVKKFTLRIGSIEEIEIDYEKNFGKEHFIKCKSTKTNNISINNMAALKTVFDNSKTVFSFINNEKLNEIIETSSISFYIGYVLNTFIDKLEEGFRTQSINYVSPLRAHPKRYYFLDKAKTNIFLDTLDGEAIAEILKEDSKLKSNVNLWLKKFNLHVDVGQLKDIIHSIVVKQNSLELDLTDVGFGVSQVLPVIIQGFLSKENSITLIEQPEIHLHPTMQADLSDLFIDIALPKTKKTPYKYLVVETHSEYLLKRLRRRISEKRIKNDDVAIYYVESQKEETSAVIRRIDIDSKGAFEWPIDFYSGELAKDVTEFIKNQM